MTNIFINEIWHHMLLFTLTEGISLLQSLLQKILEQADSIGFHV